MSQTPVPYRPVTPPPAEVFARPPDRRRQPVVVDANGLIEDAVYRVDHDWSALAALAGAGRVTLLAPNHIDTEVYEHLPRVAHRTGRSPERALAVWEELYRPFIRFVDVSTSLLLADEHVVEVARSDVDDGPVMALARLVGPSLIVTRDKHITRAGSGQSDWLTALHLVGGLTELDALLWGSAQAIWLSVALPTIGIAELGKRIARNPWALGAVVGVSVGLAFAVVSEGVPDIRAKVRSANERLAPGFARMMDAATEAFEQRAAQTRALDRFLVPGPRSSTLPTRAARLLAEFGGPVPLAELHSALGLAYSDVTLPMLREALRRESAFRAVRGRGYELGRLGGPA